MSNSLNRRDALRLAAGLALAGVGQPSEAAATQAATRAVTRGRIRQSVSRWCYKQMALPDLCRAVSALGVPNLITFFGNRQGRSDREAIGNCVAGLNRLKAANSMASPCASSC